MTVPLVSFHENPEAAIPDQNLVELLHSLCHQPNTDIAIISGRDQAFIDKWFGDLPLRLVAEHGHYVRPKEKKWSASTRGDKQWMDDIKPIFESFMDRTPGTFIEEKYNSLVWHYRKTDPELAAGRVVELKTVLSSLISDQLSMMDMDKALEVIDRQIDKGTAAAEMIGQHPYDFILCIGDDVTDENMFSALPDDAFTIKVGKKPTIASYSIAGVSKVKRTSECINRDPVGMRTASFLSKLKCIFQNVIDSPKSVSAEEIRIKNAIKVREVFKEIGVQVKGTENLPYESGSIFIYNHLNNHPDLIVGDQFQITLDSHFISSILHTYYGNPGTRVTRHALPNEKSHQMYYDLLGYIRVFAEPFIPMELRKKLLKKENKSSLKQPFRNFKMAIVWCVVRKGFLTEHQTLQDHSKKGVFALASSMNPQPKIVPIVLANFDLLPKDVEYKCKIMEPFRMSDYGIFDPKDPMIDEVVKTIKLKYQKWVKKLCVADQNFEQEITVLKRRSVQKAQQNDLIVFFMGAHLFVCGI